MHWNLQTSRYSIEQSEGGKAVLYRFPRAIRRYMASIADAVRMGREFRGLGRA